ALVLCPRPFLSFNNLADGLRVRVKQRGVLGDLDETIELRWHFVLHSRRSLPLNNLAITLRVRFE
ncbi:hypothetical protein BD769DRAFT_1350874, partial [Suillus cothurnatus]